MCRINYEIQTITSQLVFYLKDFELADKVATIFTVLLPIGGVVGKSQRNRISMFVEPRFSRYSNHRIIIGQLRFRYNLNSHHRLWISLRSLGYHDLYRAAAYLNLNLCRPSTSHVHL